MAIYYFRNVGTDWNNATNWSLTDGGGAAANFPVLGDTANFTSLSGNCTLTANAACTTLVFSGVGAGNYTGTFDVSSAAVIVSGDITFSATMTIVGSGSGIVANSTGNITSNGVTVPGIRLGNASSGITITLVDTLNVTNLYIGNAAGTYAINNASINVSGNLTIGTNTTNNVLTIGTSAINLIGTGTWSSTNTNGNTIGNNLTINTAGTITISGQVGFGNTPGNTLTYSSGTVSCSSATLLIPTSRSATLNCTSAMQWGSILMISSSTVTLTGDFYCNNLTVQTNGIINTSTAKYIYVSGNCTHQGTSSFTGTSKVIMAGTGTLQTTSTGIININIEINTLGTITISGTFRYAVGTFKYTTAASVVTTGSTFTTGAQTTVTLDTNGMSWNNVSLSAAVTVTNLSNLTISGNLACSTTTIINGFSTFIGGSLTQSNSTLFGTTTMVMTGTGTITCGAAGQIGSTAFTFEIATSGTITFASIFRWQGALLKYTSGTVNTTTNNNTFFYLANNTTLNTAGIVWNNVTLANGATAYTVTLASDLTLTGLLTIGHTASTAQVINGVGRTINAGGGITLTGTTSIISGTAAIRATGGTITGTNTVQLRNNLEIAGNVTFSSANPIYYNTGTFKYTSGVVTATGSTIISALATTFDTVGLTFNNVSLTGAATYTLSSLLQVGGTLTMGGGNQTLAGAAGFTANTLSIVPTAVRTVTLTANNTYTVTNNLTLTGASAGAKLSMVSTSPTVRAIFTVNPGTVQSVTNTNATRIDSSLGDTVLCGPYATLVDTLNWNVPYVTDDGTFLLMFGA